MKSFTLDTQRATARKRQIEAILFFISKPESHKESNTGPNLMAHLLKRPTNIFLRFIVHPTIYGKNGKQTFFVHFKTVGFFRLFLPVPKTHHKKMTIICSQFYHSLIYDKFTT